VNAASAQGARPPQTQRAASRSDRGGAGARRDARRPQGRPARGRPNPGRRSFSAASHFAVDTPRGLRDSVGAGTIDVNGPTTCFCRPIRNQLRPSTKTVRPIRKEALCSPGRSMEGFHPAPPPSRVNPRSARPSVDPGCRVERKKAHYRGKTASAALRPASRRRAVRARAAAHRP